MNLLATTDILNSLKMGERLKRSNLNRTVRQSLAKREGKKSGPAAVLSLNHILVTNLSQRQSKGESLDLPCRRDLLLYLPLIT